MKKLFFTQSSVISNKYQKWAVTILGSQDGETVEIRLPFRVMCKHNQKKTPAIKKNIFFFETTFITVVDEYGAKYEVRAVYDNEKEAAKAILKSLDDFNEWHSNSKAAPVTNYFCWKEKADAAFERILELYLEKYPEIFI